MKCRPWSRKNVIKGWYMLVFDHLLTLISHTRICNISSLKCTFVEISKTNLHTFSSWLFQLISRVSFEIYIDDHSFLFFHSWQTFLAHAPSATMSMTFHYLLIHFIFLIFNFCICETKIHLSHQLNKGVIIDIMTIGFPNFSIFNVNLLFDKVSCSNKNAFLEHRCRGYVSCSNQMQRRWIILREFLQKMCPLSTNHWKLTIRLSRKVVNIAGLKENVVEYDNLDIQTLK